MTHDDGSLADLRAFIENAHPCVGARSALTRDTITVRRYADLRDAADDACILADLTEFVAGYRRTRQLFSSFVMEFAAPDAPSEAAFEDALWQRLGALSQLDRQTTPWDARVGSDPAALDFSFSLRGEAFFVIGLHPNASRASRRYRMPALVMNLHDQFERLRGDGRYDRMREVIRERDTQFCGSPNPMVRNFGDLSEARQYSGRSVEADWRCPFDPRD